MPYTKQPLRIITATFIMFLTGLIMNFYYTRQFLDHAHDYNALICSGFITAGLFAGYILSFVNLNKTLVSGLLFAVVCVFCVVFPNRHTYLFDGIYAAPSILALPFLIFYTVSLFTDKKAEIFKTAIFLLLYSVLIISMRHGSMMLLMTMLVIFIAWVSTCSLKHKITVTVFVSVLFILILPKYFTSAYYPFTSTLLYFSENGYPLTMSYNMIHTGGLLGKGLPYPTGILPGLNSYSISLLISKTGFIGTVVFLSLYTYVIWVGIQTLRTLKDHTAYSGTLIKAILFLLAVNGLLHIGICFGLIPFLRCVNMPFLSLNSSFEFIVAMLMVILFMNIAVAMKNTDVSAQGAGNEK